MSSPRSFLLPKFYGLFLLFVWEIGSIAEVLLGETFGVGRVVAAVGHREPHGSVGFEVLVEAVEHRSCPFPVCGFCLGACGDDLDAAQHAGEMFFDQALVGVEHDLDING